MWLVLEEDGSETTMQQLKTTRSQMSKSSETEMTTEALAENEVEKSEVEAASGESVEDLLNKMRKEKKKYLRIKKLF